jgi:hypothetical protein
MAKGIKTHKKQISSFTKNTCYRQDIYVYYGIQTDLNYNEIQTATKD